jgi:hypothetical protein
MEEPPPLCLHPDAGNWQMPGSLALVAVLTGWVVYGSQPKEG